MVLILVFLCVFGIYTNLYIFYMFNIRTLFAAFLLPFGGFFLGGAMAAICRFEWRVIKVCKLSDIYMLHVHVSVVCRVKYPTKPCLVYLCSGV